MGSLVKAKEIDSIKLYTLLERWHQLDAGPFVLIYTLWIVAALRTVVTGQWQTYGTAIKLGTYGLVVSHILLELFTYWSVRVRCAVRFKAARRLEDATHVRVVPHAFSGTKDVVPLKVKQVEGGVQLGFEFRKLRFLYSSEEGTFQKLKYYTKESFATYRGSSGYGSEAKVGAALERWGPNRFEVPVPAFLELLREQMLAPFFVFQVFCVGLWALDEYWYYSLFTLAMLVMFECTVVGQRQRNLHDVRALQQPKQALQVYRGGKWAKIAGDQLLPGDVVSVARADGGEDPVVPADLLLLAGSCIVDEAVLTGESTPQWKNPVGEATGDEVDASELAPSCRLSIKRDKQHVLFGGTKLLQTMGDKAARIKTPDSGCLAVVLRTGFGTAQGRLMRTILYSTERVTANNWETGFFIAFLLIWAIAASGYVLYHGLQDPDRDRFKLILNCIMILTSVIPPELPMELTIAVNASLLSLARKKVFCTEPFRIPLAGKVTTCCFDKTGTLTSDHMVLEGVAGAEGAEAGHAEHALVTDVRGGLPGDVHRVLACCQSLVQVERGLVGDPVERAAVEATGWVCKQDSVSSPGPHKEVAHILHRFHFSSLLKRMSTVVRVESADAGAKESWWVLTKGAPEVVQGLLATVPSHYERCYKRYAAEGARVLALAYKRVEGEVTPSVLRHMPRDQAEHGLMFAGFAVFRSPLKPESAPALLMLRASQHQLVMITGDAPLTACYAARQVHIVTRAVLVLTRSATASNGSSLAWLSPDEQTSEPFSSSPADAWALAEAYDLCVTGDALAALQDMGAAPTYIPLTQVFARVNPEQKEVVVKTLRAAGLTVLMCGDGTNDVGALKGAHVGVALLAPPEKPKARPGATGAGSSGKSSKGSRPGSGGRSSSTAPAAAAALPPAAGLGPGPLAQRPHQQQQQQQDGHQAWQRGSGGGGGAGPDGPAPAKVGPGTKMLEDMRRAGKPITPWMARMAKSMDDMAAANDQEVGMVKPGDASMASPFTAKDASVMPCLDILKQGRCTLVTTVQMFKILGLLCLSSAYGLSVLYLDGIKLGDMQATLQGVLTAGMFFFISHAQPLPELSRERPHPRVFSRYVFTSLLGQFGVYIAFLMAMQHMAHALMPKGAGVEAEVEERQEPDGEFKPNLVNTICYLVNFAIQTMTFTVNYIGRPFNTPLRENKFFFRSIRFSAIIYVLLVLDLPPGFQAWFSLVGIPYDMQVYLIGGAGLAFLLGMGIERFARAAFPAALPPARGGLTKSSSRPALAAGKRKAE
ncbi:hypothetical protein N2152v2_004936 [Parachlorella kessleri]